MKRWAKKVVDEQCTDSRAEFSLSPKRIGLVALRDGSNDFEGLVEAVGNSGCDTIVFALRGDLPRKLVVSLFSSCEELRTLFVEMRIGKRSRIEVHRKNVVTPHFFVQRLKTSRQSNATKQGLIDNLPARRFGSVLFLACGESNIISTSKDVSRQDPYGFFDQLKGVNLILNPSHTRMRRPEMAEKRRRMSVGRSRVLLSVSQYTANSVAAPWRAFVNGIESNTRIAEEVTGPRNSFRVGVFVGS